MDMGKAIILKKKDGVKVYPVTSSDLVFHPTTKKTITEEIDELKSDSLEETVIINVIGIESGYTITIKDVFGLELGKLSESSATLHIKAGTEYIVEANNVEGYTSPEQQRFVAVANNTRNVNVVYYKDEILTVTVTGAESGFTITVKGEDDRIIGTSTEKVSVFSIPKGTLYMVKASEVPGYIGNGSWGYFTAEAGGSRSITMVYTKQGGTTEPENGVYIKATDGKYYQKDEWHSGLTPDCIAVITDNHRFGVALSEKNNMRIVADDTKPLESYLTAFETESQAITDLMGEQNTIKIMSLEPSEEFAAGWCNAYAFPSGKKGYLPALGEWAIVYQNIGIVNELLALVGGSAFAQGNVHRSSTFQGLQTIMDTTYRNCWGIRLDDGRYSKLAAGSDYRVVRPFCSLV